MRRFWPNPLPPVAHLECLNYVLVLEVPDEDGRVATPTDEVTTAVQETATCEAPSILEVGGGSSTCQHEYAESAQLIVGV